MHVFSNNGKLVVWGVVWDFWDPLMKGIVIRGVHLESQTANWSYKKNAPLKTNIVIFQLAILVFGGVSVMSLSNALCFCLAKLWNSGSHETNMSQARSVFQR